ncbi:MAG TPA: hypothetical protein PLO56_09275 [Rhodothermales bacterium]|nr:hypothetical protein [Rhodothermales bacterium]
MRLRLSSALMVWLLSCSIGAFVLDTYATRPLPILVESFRSEGMTDEQVVQKAMRTAREQSANWWWVHDRKATLVFAKTRSYDPTVYKTLPMAFLFENTPDITISKASL